MKKLTTPVFKPPIGVIKVGKYKNGKYPKFDGFKNVVVHTKASAYGELSPYVLSKEGQIMENIWQFSKVYKKVEAQSQYYNRFRKNISWEHPSEEHVDKNGDLTKEYFSWRTKGFNFPEPVRYPNGYKGKNDCMYSIKDPGSKKLAYIDSRKEIYVPLYNELVRKEKKFDYLKNELKKGRNLNIIEVDGPNQESLLYYIEKYGVEKDFIKDGAMIATKENLKIMLNDKKHPFGHGYCLAMSLMDWSVDDLN